MQERGHPAPTETDLLDTSSMRWTVGTMQVCITFILSICDFYDVHA